MVIFYDFDGTLTPKNNIGYKCLTKNEEMLILFRIIKRYLNNNPITIDKIKNSEKSNA